MGAHAINTAFFLDNLCSHFIEQVKEYAIFAMDTEGMIASWNIGAERIKGYSEEEVIGQYYGMLFTGQDQKEGKPEQQLELTRKLGKYEAEGWRQRKDGSLFWADISLSAVYDGQNKLLGFTKVTRDLTQEKRQEEEMVLKNEQLTKINADLNTTNKDLDNFIYTASHDLKAPILNIEGLVLRMSRFLESEPWPSKQIHQLLEHVQESITRFKKTLNDLTSITGLQSGQGKENAAEKVDIAAIYKEVMSDLSYVFEQLPCRFVTDFRVKDLSFSAKNFRSILYNLISNAIKYRSKSNECTIKLQTFRTQGYVLLIIEDNGLGICEKNQSQLFTLFTRFHDHVEGSGIGLYIVKRILENAGGKIEVESKEEEGTSFRVYFKEHASGGTMSETGLR